MSGQHITIDDEEMELIEKYEQKFACVPPVAFLDPPTSKKKIRASLRSNRLFCEGDIKED